VKTLTATKVALYLGIHRNTLENMIKGGRFPVKPIAGTKPRRWNTEDVKKWVKTNDDNQL